MFSGWHHGLTDTDSVMTRHGSISMFDRSLPDTFTVKCDTVKCDTIKWDTIKCVTESSHWFSIAAIFGKRSASRQGTIGLIVRQEPLFVERDDCNSKLSQKRIITNVLPLSLRDCFKSRWRYRKWGENPPRSSESPCQMNSSAETRESGTPMKTLSLIGSAAIALPLFLSCTAWASELPKSENRADVLAKLKANKVNVGSLTIETKDGGSQINLGLAENGEVANNATDENLGLIAQLPELERVTIYYGKYTKEGLSALALLPKLRGLQIYKSDVPPDAFAVLPKLTQLTYLSLGEYPVTDEILGYAGQIKGLKTFDHTQSAITPTGFLAFLNGVESLEQLTLFGDFVDDAAMKRIGQMQEMKRLWTDSKKITTAGWIHLIGLTKMQDLFLSNTSIGDDDLRALEGMKDLKSLGLNKTHVTDAGMPSLAGLTKLHDLGFEGTKVTDQGMAALKGMTELENLYVGMTDVTVKGLAFVPQKERMQMMRAGKGAMTAKQLDEMRQLYPKTQIFDPSGYWTNERIAAAMKELGKEYPPKK